MPYTPEQLEDFKGFSFMKLIEVLEYQGMVPPPEHHFDTASDIKVRFRAPRSLGFAPRDIDHVALVDLPDGRQMVDVRVPFMGIQGPSSPLPPSYTEWIMHDDRDVVPIEDFLDFFNHTLIRLVQTIWRKYRYELRYQYGAGDVQSRRIVSLIGLSPAMEASPLLPERSLLLPQLGLAAMYSRSADAVAAMIAHYFSVPAHIQEFVKRTLVLPEEQRNQLGVRQTVLGESLLLGCELVDRVGKFTLKMGPLSADQFVAFLPNGKDHGILISYVRFLIRDPLEWDIELELSAGETAGWQLGGEEGVGGRLGWTTWVHPDESKPVRMSLDPWPNYEPESVK